MIFRWDTASIYKSSNGICFFPLVTLEFSCKLHIKLLLSYVLRKICHCPTLLLLRCSIYIYINLRVKLLEVESWNCGSNFMVPLKLWNFQLILLNHMATWHCSVWIHNLLVKIHSLYLSVVKGAPVQSFVTVNGSLTCFCKIYFKES